MGNPRPVVDWKRSPNLLKIRERYPFERRQFEEDLNTARKRMVTLRDDDHYNSDWLRLYERLFGMGFNLLDRVNRAANIEGEVV